MVSQPSTAWAELECHPGEVAKRCAELQLSNGCGGVTMLAVATPGE